MRHLIIVLVFATFAFAQTPPIEPGVSHDLAKWRAAHYSDVRYKLDLTLEKMSPVLKGTIEIRVKVGARTLLSATPGTGVNTPIVLDWRRITGHEAASTLANVTLNGQPVESRPSAGARTLLSATPGTGVIPPLVLDLNGAPVESRPSADADKSVRAPADADKSVRAPFEERDQHLIFRDGVVEGENVIKLDFTSPILTSGSAITRYVDKEDGSEYIYSLFVPSDASTAFPVFDQPDLKARFELTISAPIDWRVISNGEELQTSISSAPDWKLPLHHRPIYDLSVDVSKPTLTAKVSNTPTVAAKFYSRYFSETKPISTYVFAFAAGPFERVSEPPAVAGGLTQPSTVNTKTDNPGIAGLKLQPPATAGGSDPVTSIFVRKSQAAKFKPHAAEVFRLNREGIKYLEQYFDYKFPFPKYDIVLIPEFPFGGMEHAGATFLREASVIFPTEPTANDYISRANLIFHEAAHQWFGDAVTMKWFDDLWLKEGFAEFMAYKTLEKVMPEYNAWKVFYERNKQAAYLTDSTKGTTPIYQPIANLSNAKSAYGNIVYRKAPSFLRQAEFYIGEDKFQTAVRAFLQKHEFGNAGWEDLVGEFGDVSWQKFSGASYTRFKGQRNPDGSVTMVYTTETPTGLSAKDLAKAEIKGRREIREWANNWVNTRGLSVVRLHVGPVTSIPPYLDDRLGRTLTPGPDLTIRQTNALGEKRLADLDFEVLLRHKELDNVMSATISRNEKEVKLGVHASQVSASGPDREIRKTPITSAPVFVFPNYRDHDYGIFLLDDKGRDYVLKNIQNEKDDFLRTMMWGSLWDSVREAELDPRDYVELVLKNLGTEASALSTDFSRPPVGRKSGKGTTDNVGGSSKRPPKGGTQSAGTRPTEDESTIQTLLGRVSTSLKYYVSEPPASAGGTHVDSKATTANKVQRLTRPGSKPPAYAGGSDPTATDLAARFETMLLDRLQHAATPGQRITFFRAFVSNAVTERGRQALKQMIADSAPSKGGAAKPMLPLKTKDRFDIVTRLAILGDADAERLLAEIEKTETSDEAKRYAYAARAGFATAANKAKYWNDFTTNKQISESWIEEAFGPFNSIRHSDLTLPYLERALAELPNLKRDRKIFFVNGWLAAFIGGQRSEAALTVVNKFLADNPNLDNDLRLKILENVDTIERAVKIRAKYPGMRP